MATLDDELVARARAWCTAAGRPAREDEVRDALAPLSWDELLAVRAVLADAPPGGPFGPRALVALAHGAAPAEAAALEREGDAPAAEAAPGAPAAREAVERPRRGRKAGPAAAPPTIRRARDRVPAAGPPVLLLPRLDELFADEGRAVLERLIREHGARRGPIVAALAGGWERAAGGAPDDSDLDQLLEAHGLARAFAHRERDELLYALRSAAGEHSRAATTLGMDPARLDAALERLGATAEAAAIRDTHRAELRRRATLSERARLLLSERARLEDLGLLAEFEDDLRRRLPEHVRALRASSAEPVRAALGRSLALAPREVAALATALGLEPLLAEAVAPAALPDRRAARGAPRRSAGGRPQRGGAPDRAQRGGAPDRAQRGGAPDRAQRGGPRRTGGRRSAGPPRKPRPRRGG